MYKELHIILINYKTVETISQRIFNDIVKLHVKVNGNKIILDISLD